jgi:hypothetical protein
MNLARHRYFVEKGYFVSPTLEHEHKPIPKTYGCSYSYNFEMFQERLDERTQYIE